MRDHRGSFALAASEQLFPHEQHVPAETLIQGLSELDAEALLTRATAVAGLVQLDGHSDTPALALGAVLRVRGEGLGSRTVAPESFGTYRLVALSHHVDGAGNYANEFRALPHFLDVPPLRPGHDAPQGAPELAEVIDNADPARLGRLRVRYHWPVARPAQAETDWLRVLTPYSGDGKGQLFQPEVGSQVLVGYRGNLAEQPFVLGNLFHADNKQKATYTHNGGEVKGIQTKGGNKLTFFDKKGEEKIVITNGQHKETAVEITFKGAGRIELKTTGDISLAAGKNVSIQAGENVSIRAGKKISLNAEELASETSQATAIKASAKVTVTGTSGVDVKGIMKQSS